MAAESRLVYQTTIVMVLIIFICNVPSVRADEGDEIIALDITNKTALNEIVTDNPTETMPDNTVRPIPTDITLETTDGIPPDEALMENSVKTIHANATEQTPADIKPEPTILTPIKTVIDPTSVQTTGNAPFVDAHKRQTGQKSINHVQIQYGKKNITNNVAKDTSLESELKAYGVQDSETIMVPSPELVTRYDFVTVDNKVLREQLKTGNCITISIGGTDYPAELSRMNFENIDDDIDSYHGTLRGIKNSDLLFTTSEKVLIGRITLENETYWINPVESRQKTETSESPLHIIYNSGDVTVKTIKIDDGPAPVSEKTTELYKVGVSGINQTIASSLEKTPLSRTVTVNILVVTDEEFYNNSYWIPFAQNIIAEANSALTTSDINVVLNPIYDDSRRSQFSGDPDITNHPEEVVKKVYTYPILNATNADIVLYLGGYNVNGDAQGGSWGYGYYYTFPDLIRYAWAQMVYDDIGYTGTTHGQAVVSIHEIGHLFGACHENQKGCPTYAQAHNLVDTLDRTVMWSWYNDVGSLTHFSSDTEKYQEISLGDIYHDNSRNISETRDVVAGYANCDDISPPTAGYSWNPESAIVGQEIVFHDDSGNIPISWYWDFGDGWTSSDQNPKHAYSTSPPTLIYKVRLTAMNCAGSSSAEHNIIITQPANHVNLSGLPQSGGPPLAVQFTDSSNPIPTSWNWSFGDGYTSSAQNPQHTYYQNGSYTVTLTVVQDGVPSTKILPNYITVAPQAPNASITSFINSGTAPLFIQFNDTSINNPTRWNWSFDDGTKFNTTNPLQKNVSHTFTTARTYNVSLTAANSLGSSTAFQLITATNTPPPADTSPFEKTAAGLYTYTSPAGIYSVNITIVGAGGGGGGGTYDSISGTSNGGKGGNASQVLNTTRIISPGSVITVKVGAKGTGGKGQCGQINGNPGSDGGYSGAGNIIVSGGPGGRGGIYSPTVSQPNGLSGQDGFGFGHYASSGYAGTGTGGVGGIGRGAGGGGAGGGCGSSAFGGNGADGYVYIQPVVSPPPLANFTATPRSGLAPLTVRFTDTSTGNRTNWSWNFGDGNTTNATKQNPVHTYWSRGSFNVSLTATNAGGSNTTTKVRYIRVTNATDIGVYRSGQWILDYGIDGSVDRRFNYGIPNDTPVVGDFNNDGRTDIGVYRSGQWILDYGIDGTVDRRINYGTASDSPFVGDFNNDGTTDIGVYRSGQWILDYGIDGTVDRRLNYGTASDSPINGDFNNDGTTDIGVFRSGQWTLDYGIDGTVDRQFNYGMASDIPVVGDFNNDGRTDTGVFRSGQWILDYGIDGTVDRRVNYGMASDIPVVGDFNN